MPAITVAREEKAVVKPVRAVDPELDPLRAEVVAAPVRRPGNLSRMLLAELLDLLFELFAALEDAALIGNRCADLAGPRTAVEVGVYIACGQF